MNTPRLLPVAQATPTTTFLGPPAVWCGLGLHREKRDSQSGVTEERCMEGRRHLPKR